MLSSTALAQPSAADLEKGSALYGEAEKYFKVGSYNEALKLYQDGYRLTDLPRFLINIGQCQKYLKNYAEALKAYKTYIRDVSGTDDDLLDSLKDIQFVLVLINDLPNDPDHHRCWECPPLCRGRRLQRGRPRRYRRCE
jgi:tetratricopeptide (TPR) repeat protein